MVTYLNYSYPDLTAGNVSSVGGLMQWANTQTLGALGLGIIVAIFGVLLISMMLNNVKFKNSLTVSLFISTVSAIILRWVDLIQEDLIINLLIILTTACIVWLFASKEQTI